MTRIQRLKNPKKSIQSPSNTPRLFYIDAIRQYALNEVEIKLLDPIEGWSNALPPLGFLGTVLGMMIQFFNNNGHVNAQISSMGIGTALGSTILALLFYVILEIGSIFLRRSALTCVDKALATYQSQEKGTSKGALK